jgi:hypothetical protein
MTYVWDDNEKAAVATLDHTDPRPHIPTIDRDVLAEWRQRFAAERVATVALRHQELLERWSAREVSCSSLVASRSLCSDRRLVFRFDDEQWITTSPGWSPPERDGAQSRAS